MLKSQLDLHLAVAEDQLRLCGVPFTRDLATIRSRVEERGEEFLTLDLPASGKAFDKAIDKGRMDANTFSLFKKRGPGDQRPAFLNGLFAQVFDAEGSLLPVVNPHAVRALRQIFYLHSKLKELPTDDKVEAALAAYVETDQNISNAIPFELREEFRKMAREMYGTYFARMEASLFEDSFLTQAKHGPGAVSDPISANQKWNNREWSERLSSFFPAHEYLRTGSRDPEVDVFLLPPACEHPSRVIAVPKTAKGPRIIAAEPVYNQFVQQGLMSMFTDWMYSHPVVSFEYQEPNQDLARKGSIDGSVATIDLSEASDRVSLALVKTLFRDHPYLLSVILACRTQRAVLPDGNSIALRKFASMGSALTFPLETLIFSIIAYMGVKRSGMSVKATIRNGNLRVYGDDIIVPVQAVDETVSLLEAFGLKVNMDKSFWTGEFRESCGGDFYAGFPVNPVKTRRRIPSSRRDSDGVVSIVAFRNLYWEQYGPTEFVTSLDSFIEGIIPFPEGFKTTDALVRWSYHPSPEGMDPWLHRPYVHAIRVVNKKREDRLDGEGALLKYFWSPEGEDGLRNPDPKHLQFAGRPRASILKYGRVVL
jgi:hypothetical protein